MNATQVDPLLPVGTDGPLVRATRSQGEVRFLPPYGDPEVHIPGELATYVLAGSLAAVVYDHLQE